MSISYLLPIQIGFQSWSRCGLIYHVCNKNSGKAHHLLAVFTLPFSCPWCACLVKHCCLPGRYWNESVCNLAPLTQLLSFILPSPADTGTLSGFLTHTTLLLISPSPCSNSSSPSLRSLTLGEPFSAATSTTGCSSPLYPHPPSYSFYGLYRFSRSHLPLCDHL